MKSIATKNEKKKVFYDKQKGPKTIYKVIALNDGDQGDISFYIGYVYYSNIKVNEEDNLPVFEEKLIFKDLNGLLINHLNHDNELEVTL